MQKYLVSINDLPPEGKEFTLTDQNIWQEPLREFKMDCQIVKPISMKVFVLGADDGCLVRGTLAGSVTVPCNRCSENANVTLDSKFDEYEEIPENEKHKGEESHIVFDRNSPMLNLAAVAWEQFVLAFPQTPLCKADCKGLCPKCGTNLNLSSCDCKADIGDPRLAALRNLKIGDN